MSDAEGFHEQVPCPVCGSLKTVTYHYLEGFSELECPACGYRSDAEELSLLQRLTGELLEGPSGGEERQWHVPFRALKA